jgi:SEC-C motif
MKRDGRTSKDHEWVGGSVKLPVSVGDQDDPVLALWIELPAGVVLASKVGGQTEAMELAEAALEQALRAPLVGSARLPKKVRVSSLELGERLVTKLSRSVRVGYGPTPELAEFAADFLDHLAQAERAAYLEDGSVQAATLTAFHAAAAAFAKLQPWTLMREGRVVRVDIPTLGITAGALIVIGAHGMARALLLFPSARELATYQSLSVLTKSSGGDLPEDLGSSVLSVSFESEQEAGPRFCASFRRVAAPPTNMDAVPVLEHRDSTGTPQRLDEHDALVATACLTALAHALTRHRQAIGSAWHESLHVRAAAVEVELRHPHDVHERITSGLEAIARASRAEERAGRNDPCPCGSGKKFKRCCGSGAASGAIPMHAEAVLRGHDLDMALVARIEQFAHRELGSPQLAAHFAFVDAELAKQLSVPLRVFCYPVAGMPVAAHFLERHGSQLSAREREWLSLQLQSELGVWEVRAVVHGESMRVRELDSGRELEVREKSGTSKLRVRETLLARFVEHEGSAWMVGCHYRTLMPSQAAQVLAAARRSRAGESKPRWWSLVQAWERVVKEADAARAKPVLRNSEGHNALLTRDHFKLAAGARKQIEQAILTLPWCSTPELDERGARVFPFLRTVDPRLGSTLYARVIIHDDQLRVETDSIDRADILRSRLEGIGGSDLVHRLREHIDPLSSASSETSEAQPAEAPPPEVLAVLRLRYVAMMAAWLDEASTALGGKTPRQAVKTKAGKAKVDLLMRDMELMQGSSLPELTAELRAIRQQLGLSVD